MAGITGSLEEPAGLGHLEPLHRPIIHDCLDCPGSDAAVVALACDLYIAIVTPELGPAVADQPVVHTYSCARCGVKYL